MTFYQEALFLVVTVFSHIIRGIAADILTLVMSLTYEELPLSILNPFIGCGMAILSCQWS